MRKNGQSKATTECLLGDIRLAAKAVVGRRYGSVSYSDVLEQLRDTLAAARVVGVSESKIREVLDEVRQSDPEVTETWDQMLGEITLYVWLQDPDGNRVRGDTVVVDWLLWENNTQRVLEDVVDELLSDLETRWEVIEPAIVHG